MLKKLHDRLFPEEEQWTVKEKFLCILIYGLPLWLALALYPFTASDKKSDIPANESPTWYDVLTPEEREKLGVKRLDFQESDFTPLPDAAERFDRLLKEGGTKGLEEDIYDYLDRYLD